MDGRQFRLCDRAQLWRAGRGEYRQLRLWHRHRFLRLLVGNEGRGARRGPSRALLKLASEDLTAAVAHIAAGRRSVSSIALADGAIEAAIRAAPE